jgi:hypothetical protein
MTQSWQVCHLGTLDARCPRGKKPVVLIGQREALVMAV